MSFIFRKLPPFKGKLRLAKFLFTRNIKKSKDIWIKGKYRCVYLLPNLVENVSFEIYVNGIYEQGTSDFLSNRIPPGGVFLDLGANIGAISTPLSRRRKDIRIVCVEASPRILIIWKRTWPGTGLLIFTKSIRRYFIQITMNWIFSLPMKNSERVPYPRYLRRMLKR